MRSVPPASPARESSRTRCWPGSARSLYRVCLYASCAYFTAAAGLLWWQRGRAAEKATDTLANMEWADAPDNLDEDGCVILGVEEGGEGRAWYKCSEPSEGLECEQNESLNVDGFVCKEPSPKAT